MTTINFYDPCGSLEVSVPFAPRIDTLAGKRIGFVTNEQWQAFRMLPLLRDLIKADFPTAELLPIDAYPQGNVLIPAEDTIKQVKQSAVDAVIVGNAA